MKNTIKVPLSMPWITNSDKKAILSCLKSPHLTDGPKLREFESKVANYVGSKYAIGLSNATSALYLSLLLIGIKQGDEIIIPDLTFIATANAVLAAGAKPVLVDIDETLNISTDQIKEKINPKTKAVIPVHFAGYSCNMNEIKKISKKHDIEIIEDCAQALGTYFQGRHVGTFGITGCFSFYPTKNITTIEGGMITTNSKKIAEKITSLRNHGITKTLIQRNKSSKPWLYDVLQFGYNFRLDEVRATLGTSQLNRFKEIIRRRLKAVTYYKKELSKIRGIEDIHYKYENNHAYHLYIVRIKNQFGVRRDKVHDKLFRKGIRTTVHYKPIHKYSIFKKDHYKDKEFPNTIKAYKECLTLPLFPTITRWQQDYIISTLKAIKN